MARIQPRPLVGAHVRVGAHTDQPFGRIRLLQRSRVEPRTPRVGGPHHPAGRECTDHVIHHGGTVPPTRAPRSRHPQPPPPAHQTHHHRPPRYVPTAPTAALLAHSRPTTPGPAGLQSPAGVLAHGASAPSADPAPVLPRRARIRRPQRAQHAVRARGARCALATRPARRPDPVGMQEGPGAVAPGPSRWISAPKGSDHLTILMTRPEPTVRPPSRMAKPRPSSMAMGWISVTEISVLSPGMTISVPSGSVMTPVTSVVRK
jgi:hypothetical protein